MFTLQKEILTILILTLIAGVSPQLWSIFLSSPLAIFTGTTLTVCGGLDEWLCQSPVKTVLYCGDLPCTHNRPHPLNYTGGWGKPHPLLSLSLYIFFLIETNVSTFPRVFCRFEVSNCDIWYIRFCLDYECETLVLGNQVGKIYMWDLTSDDTARGKPHLLSHGKCTAAIRQVTVSRDGR